LLNSYESSDMDYIAWDMTVTAPENTVIMGDFSLSDGKLSIPANKCGFVTFGNEGSTDYEIRVSFEKQNNGSGQSGIFVRGTDVSLPWWEDVNKETFYGYAICPSNTGITVKWIYYGSEEIKFKSISGWGKVENRELIVRAEGNAITISIPEKDEPILVIEDADPFTHGQCGIFSTGKEFTVTNVAIQPIEN